MLHEIYANAQNIDIRRQTNKQAAAVLNSIKMNKRMLN